jgi:hypothetical protein
VPTSTRIGASARAAPQSLSFYDCFAFPLRTPEARRDLLIGALLLFTTLPGWVCNLGHRLEVVYRLFHDQRPYFRGFRPLPFVFRRGLTACFAITLYLSPALACAAVSWLLWPGTWALAAAIAGSLAFCLAVYVLPGGMTYNAAFRDVTYLYRPDKALQRALEGGRLYVKAWCIAGAAIAISLLGLLLAGVGFLLTSVWAWMVVGYAFSQSLALRADAEPHGAGPPRDDATGG